MLLDSLFDLLARTNGVGAIVAGAISIIQGENPLEAIASVTSAVTNIGTVIDGLRILVNGVQGAFELLAGNGEIVAKAWPVEPYAHPEVS